MKAPVEGQDGIVVVRRGENCRDWNGIHYQVGLSEKNVYILAGRVRHEYGDGLKQVVGNTAGDFIFIEPGIPHEVFNASDTDPVVAVVARSDASEWQNIIAYKRS